MEKDEKVRILQAAVEAAKANGFRFLEWYEKQLNIIPSARMPEIERIKHMCYLGIEDNLILDKKFAKSLNKRNWMNYLQAAVVNDSRIFYLRQYLIRYGILED